MYQTENKSFFVCAGWMKICILTMDATTMANVIKDIILRLGLDKAKLRDQYYDGCSTMMGKKKRVATLIKRDVHAIALSTRCYAHSLNLGIGSKILPSSQIHWIRRMKSRS